MAKNFLAFLGLVFLFLLTVGAIGGLGLFYDWAGLVALPDGVRQAVVDTAQDVAARAADRSARAAATPVVKVARPEGQGAAPEGDSEPAWMNLVDLDPTATTAPEEPAAASLYVPPPPEPTPTPIPPMQPDAYQALTLSSLRDYAAALQRWMQANEELGRNSELLQDAGWRERATQALEDTQSAARALDEAGPPPEEYRAIDDWFSRVVVESDGLANSYGMALETGDPGYFSAASQNLKQIKEDLSQAVLAMQDAGWELK